MIYKGDSYVLTGTVGERSPFGYWTNTYSFEGIPAGIQALISAQGVGPQISTRQAGAVIQADLTYSPDTFSDKWEIDRENVDKDIMFHVNFSVISDAGKDEIRRWRADPTSTIDYTKDSAHQTQMQQVAELVRRGVETFQVSTLILKRTRSLSTTLAPTLVLQETTAFYSTPKLIALTAMDSAIAATLPNPTAANSWKGAYAPPADSQWGWLPRNQNRSYCSKGQMEEHSDWVFGAISTALYTYVTTP